MIDPMRVVPDATPAVESGIVCHGCNAVDAVSQRTPEPVCGVVVVGFTVTSYCSNRNV